MVSGLKGGKFQSAVPVRDECMHDCYEANKHNSNTAFFPFRSLLIRSQHNVRAEDDASAS